MKELSPVDTVLTGVSETLLSLEGVSKSFGAVQAVDDVSMTLDRATCHGLIGPNGSGKTTLFNLVSGFEEPDSGTIRFEGEDVTGLRSDLLARRGLVRTFQLVTPFGGMTTRENLHSVYAGGLGANVRVPEHTQERAAELLETLGLTGAAETPAEDLSGGQQKLLEIGRALMLDPDCLLLDEPTAGVNPALQERVLDIVREVREAGTTVFVIEHDMHVIDDLADEVTVLADGAVITQDAFEEVTDDARVREAYLGRAPNPANGGSVGVSGAPDRHGGGVIDSGAVTAGKAVATTPTDSRDSPEKSPPHLRAEDVVAGYGKQTVLDGVSVRSHDGVTCVFGPNGSGKSTLLKAITGVVPVRGGAVTYGQRDITNWQPHDVVSAGITTVPQDDQVFRGLTVRENLQLGATTVSDADIATKRMEAILEVFPELDGSLSDEARSLSGGQQVMLGVARAMMTGADVYLLDEPLSGLAPSMVDSVLEVIETLVDQGTHVILVEQHVREALRVADHIYLLSQGVVQFDGTPADLRDENQLVDLYLGLG